VSVSVYNQLVEASFGEQRTGVLLNSSYYAVPATATDTRAVLERMGTDAIFKCPTWTFARSWVASGGTAYVGVYTVGATYPGNEEVPFCLEEGIVCHEDDIEIVFGTVPNPTPQQSSLTKEMQARYKAFLYNGDPNTRGVPSWPAATSHNTNAILLGSPGIAPLTACEPSFWGKAVPYDYQIYNI